MPQDNVNSNEKKSTTYNYNNAGEKKEAIFTQVRNNSDGSHESMLTQRYDVRQVESQDVLTHRSTTYSGYSSRGNLYGVTTKSSVEKNKNK